MASLCGEFEHSIDPKGRMSFPNKFREILGAEFYLIMGYDNDYIAVYSPEEFDIYQEKLATLKGTQGNNIRRKLLATADRQIPDKQGRILVTEKLRKHAKIEKEVVVIGAGHRAEIWDKAVWDEFNDSISSEDMSDALSDMTL